MKEKSKTCKTLRKKLTLFERGKKLGEDVIEETIQLLRYIVLNENSPNKQEKKNNGK